MEFGVNLYRFAKFSNSFETLVHYVQTAELLGFDQVRLLDHVVGIVAERHGGIAQTPYTAESDIHECFTLMAYLSAVTSRIRFATGILALPQRQTVVAAKQAAEVDRLSGGRLTLGVGIGYNPIEFRTLGARFEDRAKRFEEQVQVLRLLWTEPVVNFQGQWHDIIDASLAPRPIQRPIPLWFGLGRRNAPIPPDPVLERVGRLADGWFPMFQPGAEADAAIAKVHEAARNAGRNPSDIQMEMELSIESKSETTILNEIRTMREMGAVRLNVSIDATSARGLVEGLYRARDIVDKSSG